MVRFRVDGPDAELVSSASPDASRTASSGDDPGGASSHARPGGQARGPGSEESRGQEVQRQEVERQEGSGAESGQEGGPKGGKVEGEAEADGAEACTEGGGEEEAAHARSGQA